MLTTADALPELPIRTVLPALAEALAAAGAAVLVAPPGTGKTTVVPLAIAGAGGRVVAARAAARRMAQLLGANGVPAPVINAEGVLFPVDVHWSPPPGPITPPLGLRVDPRLLEHVAATVRRTLADGDGDVLVFLPGARKIDLVAGRLGGSGVDVVALHGRLSGAAQDAALRPGDRRRVVLATAVAESSLTVPGVRAVVDSGPGREAPGQVYRCWSAAQHDRLPAQPEPEVAAADLTGFALDLPLWGHPDGTGLRLLDAPAAGALQAATGTLWSHCSTRLVPPARVHRLGRRSGRGLAAAARRQRPGTRAAALLDGLRHEGLSLLTWTRTATELRERLAFCRHTFGEQWPAVADGALLAAADDWLGPELTRARRRADLAKVDVASALRRLLP